MNGFYSGFYVVAQKDGKLVETLFTTHKTTVADVSAFAAKRLALVVLQVHPWELETSVWNGEMPDDVYEVRWIGKADGMVKDCLRFEYRKLGDRKWQVQI